MTDTRPDCTRCGHTAELHDHYRSGTDCSGIRVITVTGPDAKTVRRGRCDCPRLKRPSRLKAWARSRGLITAVAVLALTLGGTVAAAPHADAGVAQAFKVCGGLDGYGGCSAYYVKAGSNFFEMPKSTRDVATSLNGLNRNYNSVTLYTTNSLGFGWGKVCATLTRAQAAHYIGDACNDQLGAVLLNY